MKVAPGEKTDSEAIEVIGDKPLVSIIVIFLNEERFIQEAIESVFAQTYPNWELLLVDDGSSDASTAIARRFANEHPGRVRYLEHPGHQNLGMSASRNLGVRSARGEYLAFLDADDVWLPHKLAGQLAILLAHPQAAMVCAPAKWWYSWTGDSKDIERDFVQRLDLPKDRVLQPPALLMLFLQDIWASLCDLIVRREAVETVGGFEDTFRGMYEDQVFHSKLCFNFPVLISSKYGYLYRQRSDSCTAITHQSGQDGFARLVYLNWLRDYLLAQKGNRKALRKAIRKEAFPLRHPKLGRIIYPIKLNFQRLARALNRFRRAFVSQETRDRLAARARSLTVWPPVNMVDFGSFDRVTPIGQIWPNYRGLPIDRYYIEKFLQEHSDDIRGVVLELGDNTYTLRFGGERVTRSEVLHAIEGNAAATIVADLTRADHIPTAMFDCIILTQTLLLIYDLKAAIQTLYRILKPGGTVLVTIPGITQIVRGDMEESGQYWSFTTLSARRLFEEAFPPASVQVKSYGNVLAAISFLHSLAAQEIQPADLDYDDPDFELVITVKAVKPGCTS